MALNLCINRINKISFISILLLLILYSTNGNAVKNKKTFKITSEDITLFDTSRNRKIPITIYEPQTIKLKKQKIIIFSHGYFANTEGANKEYSYLTNYLASKGYFVVSVQHELSSDSLIPDKGIPQIVRRPFWERGVDNILFVINELKKKYYELNHNRIILIGHSNGGDMSMLFGKKYPNLIDKIISLDSRRMPFPRTKQPKIYSLRSSDQTADEGVIPTIEEQKKFDIKIIKLKNTKHSNMDNSGTKGQKDEINNFIINFLNN